MFPILEVLDNDMPKNTEEVGASKNNNDQLHHPVELHDQESPQDRVRNVKIVVADVVLQLVVVVLVHNLLKLLHVQQLSESGQTEHLQKSEKPHF